MALVKQKVVLIKGNIMDVNLFIFDIKDSYGKTIGSWIAKEVILKGHCKWRGKRGVVTV